MNIAGWTSWGWYETENGAVRRWKRVGRDDLFVETNDDDLLMVLGGAIERMERGEGEPPRAGT